MKAIKFFKLKDNYIDIDDYKSDREIISNLGGILKNKGKERFGYYCFNYALNDKKIVFLEDAVKILFEEYKNIVKLKNIQKNDIILFSDDFYVTHLAKIIETNGTMRGTKIRARFGQLGIYEHNLKDNPTCYGYKFLIFRRNRK